MFRRTLQRSVALGLVAGGLIGAPSPAFAAGWNNYWPPASINAGVEAVDLAYTSHQRNNGICYGTPAASATIRYRTTGGSHIRVVSSGACGNLDTGSHPTESTVRAQCWNQAAFARTFSCWSYRP